MKKIWPLGILIVGILIFWLAKENQRGQADLSSRTPRPSVSTEPNNGSHASAENNAPGVNLDQELEEQLQELESSFVTIEESRKKPAEEVHHPKFELQGTGAKLGSLQDFVKQNPSTVRRATDFLSSCARNEKLVLSTRAHCAATGRNLARKGGIDVNEYLSGVPKPVRDLSDQIPND